MARRPNGLLPNVAQLAQSIPDGLIAQRLLAMVEPSTEIDQLTAAQLGDPGAIFLKAAHRVRSRANLRSPSRSAVGGYPVSVKAEPIEET